MELGSNELFEFVPIRCDPFKEVKDSGLECFEGFVIDALYQFLAHKLPQSFDEIQIRRILRKEDQFNAGILELRFDSLVPIIAGIVDNQIDFLLTGIVSFEFPEKRNRCLGVDRVILVDHDLLGFGIVRSVDIQPFSSSVAFDESLQSFPYPRAACLGIMLGMNAVNKEDDFMGFQVVFNDSERFHERELLFGIILGRDQGRMLV